jgi:hypothetical protein
MPRLPNDPPKPTDHAKERLDEFRRKRQPQEQPASQPETDAELPKPECPEGDKPAP